MDRAKDLGVLYLASFDLLPHLRGASALPPQTPDPKGPNSTKSFLSQPSWMESASQLPCDWSGREPNRKVKSGTNRIRLVGCLDAKDPKSPSGKLWTPESLIRDSKVPPSPPLALSWPAHLALCFGTGRLPPWTLLEADLSFHKIF